ncbi:MAG: glycosyltransferase family 2 protein [Candidatus Micrarchaeota archaeon]
MAPFISIVVPVYNNERTVRKCIESLINQTYTNSEIIAIDDGSKDETGKILDSYAPKIRVVHQKNAGRAEARNAGWKIARGPFVFFGEADAYYEPHYVAELAKVVEKNPNSTAGGLLRVWNRGTWLTEAIEWEQCAKQERYLKSGARTGGWIFHKSILEKLNGLDKKFIIMEDFDLFQRASKLGVKAEITSAKWFHTESSSVWATILKSRTSAFDLPILLQRYPRQFFFRVFGLLFNLAIPLALILSLLWQPFIYIFALLLLAFLYQNKSFISYGLRTREISKMLTYLIVLKYARNIGFAWGVLILLKRRILFFL